MPNSLAKKITLSMVALAVGSILLSTLLVNFALSWNFNRYLRSVQDQQNLLIVDTLAELYGESTSWQTVRLSTLYVGSTTGTQIQVFDVDGRLIADSLSGMMQGMQGRRWEQDQQLRGQTYDYPLYVRGQRIGTVEITHLGQQGLWTTEALLFRTTVNRSALLTGLAVILVAMIVGSMVTRRLTGRLSVLTATAEKWGDGRFGSKVEVSGDDELAVLGETMNRMASRLEEQSTLRRKLTGDISHELRTPLTTIQSYLEAFNDGVLEADAQNVNAVLEESHRLGRLVNDLQDLTNAEYHGRAINLQAVDLSAYVPSEVQRSQPLFTQKGIYLKFDELNKPLSVLADEGLLGRILGNLLVNAYKYTPDGGTVTVTFVEAGDFAGIEITDTGIGIGNEHLPYIFERFYRVDPSRTRTTGGSGIGLAIVKELVEGMGGEVFVSSTPGQGSSFRVLLRKSH